jgi:hypothetical protein
MTTSPAFPYGFGQLRVVLQHLTLLTKRNYEFRTPLVPRTPHLVQPRGWLRAFALESVDRMSDNVRKFPSLFPCDWSQQGHKML